MLQKLPSLNRLLKTLQQVPYLASKNLYRVALHFVTMDERKLDEFCAIVKAAKQNSMQCTVCFAWQEKGSSCMFCADKKRNQSVVCVLETWQELLAIEKTGGYEGVYHVLGSAICPLEGIGPDDVTIKQLVERVSASSVTEIILATNQTPEGEATAAYIARQLKDSDITISCLARGMPVGSSLDTLDRVTVYKALAERRKF